MRIPLDIRKALSKGPDPQVPSRINGDGDDEGDEDAGAAADGRDGIGLGMMVVTVVLTGITTPALFQQSGLSVITRLFW